MISLDSRLRCLITKMHKQIIRKVTTFNSDNFDSYQQRQLKSWKEIPGPSSLPVIGSMHHYFPTGIFHSYDGIDLDTKLYETYGPIVRLENVIGRDPQIFIYDPESAKQILQGENRLPVRPGMETLEYYLKHIKENTKTRKSASLLTGHGNEWKEQRSIVNPVMLKQKTVKLYTAVLDEVTKDMVVRIKSIKDKNNRLKTQFEYELNLLSLEANAMIILGYRLGCLDLNRPNEFPGKKMIECLQEAFTVFAKLDFGPTLWKFFSTPNFKNLMNLYELQNTLSKKFIDQAVENFNNGNISDTEKSIIHKLWDINEDFAIETVTELLFAGIQTISNTMASTLYLLATNLDKQNILREELQSSDEKKPYLKACIKESIRLMPVISEIRRLTTKEYDLLGYKIPPNMRVVIRHQLMCQMDNIFPRPNEYIPERWLLLKDDPLSYSQVHSMAYRPFGFGSRICIARRIAELMLELFTARMVEHFQLEWVGPPPTRKEMFLNYVKGPSCFIFKDI